MNTQNGKLHYHAEPTPGVIRADGAVCGNMVYAPSLRAFGAWLNDSQPAMKRGNGIAKEHGLTDKISTVLNDKRKHAFPESEKRRLRGMTIADLCAELATIQPTWDDSMAQGVNDALAGAVREITQAVRVWDQRPGSMSMDRLFEGRQDWMSRRRRVRKPSKVISLAVPISANWTINADVLRIMGIASTVAADILSKRGFNVEIIAFEAGKQSHSNKAAHSMQIVRLKGAKDTLRPTEVVNGMSSWAFRSLWFSGICALDPKTVNRGLGYARGVNDDMKAEMRTLMGVDDVVILDLVPTSNNIPNAIKQAVKVVQEGLKEYLN